MENPYVNIQMDMQRMQELDMMVCLVGMAHGTSWSSFATRRIRMRRRSESCGTRKKKMCMCVVVPSFRKWERNLL